MGLRKFDDESLMRSPETNRRVIRAGERMRLQGMQDRSLMRGRFVRVPDDISEAATPFALLAAEVEADLYPTEVTPATPDEAVTALGLTNAVHAAALQLSESTLPPSSL